MRLNIEKANTIAEGCPDFWHEWTRESLGTLVKKVDRCIGGWPSDAKQLMFYHGDYDGSPCGRRMRFTGPEPNSGWWTRVLTDEQYYLSKAGLGNLELYDSEVRMMETTLHEAFRRLNKIKRKTNGEF